MPIETLEEVLEHLKPRPGSESSEQISALLSGSTLEDRLRIWRLLGSDPSLETFFCGSDVHGLTVQTVQSIMASLHRGNADGLQWPQRYGWCVSSSDWRRLLGGLGVREMALPHGETLLRSLGIGGLQHAIKRDSRIGPWSAFTASLDPVACHIAHAKNFEDFRSLLDEPATEVPAACDAIRCIPSGHSWELYVRSMGGGIAVGAEETRETILASITKKLLEHDHLSWSKRHAWCESPEDWDAFRSSLAITREQWRDCEWMQKNYAGLMRSLERNARFGSWVVLCRFMNISPPATLSMRERKTQRDFCRVHAIETPLAMQAYVEELGVPRERWTYREWLEDNGGEAFVSAVLADARWSSWGAYARWFKGLTDCACFDQMLVFVRRFGSTDDRAMMESLPPEADAVVRSRWNAVDASIRHPWERLCRAMGQKRAPNDSEDIPLEARKAASIIARVLAKDDALQYTGGWQQRMAWCTNPEDFSSMLRVQGIADYDWHRRRKLEASGHKGFIDAVRRDPHVGSWSRFVSYLRKQITIDGLASPRLSLIPDEWRTRTPEPVPAPREHAAGVYPPRKPRAKEHVSPLILDPLGFCRVPEGDRTVLYGTLRAWSLMLAISDRALVRVLESVNYLHGPTGSDAVPQRLYSENVIRSRCHEFLEIGTLGLRPNEHGFFSIYNIERVERYATARFWARTFGVDLPYLLKQLKAVRGVTVRDAADRAEKDPYYPETFVRILLAHEIKLAAEQRTSASQYSIEEELRRSLHTHLTDIPEDQMTGDS